MPEESKKQGRPVTEGPGERTALSRYLSDIRGIVRLTEEEEGQLRDQEAADRRTIESKLVRSTLPFVIKVAQEYRGLGLPIEDLLCEGNLGLMEAARRFDASRGTRFSTYAVWWIRKSILSALSSKVDLVRLPTAKSKTIRKIRDAETELRRALGRAPSRQEISEHLNEGLDTVDRMLQHRRRVISLDIETKDDKPTLSLHEKLGDSGTTPEQTLLGREAAENLEQALSRLTDRERLVLECRYGLGSESGMTLNEIGRAVGLSRERVRQIETQARQRLRRMLGAKKFSWRK